MAALASSTCALDRMVARAAWRGTRGTRESSWGSGGKAPVVAWLRRCAQEGPAPGALGMLSGRGDYTASQAVKRCRASRELPRQAVPPGAPLGFPSHTTPGPASQPLPQWYAASTDTSNSAASPQHAAAAAAWPAYMFFPMRTMRRRACGGGRGQRRGGGDWRAARALRRAQCSASSALNASLHPVYNAPPHPPPAPPESSASWQSPSHEHPAAACAGAPAGQRCRAVGQVGSGEVAAAASTLWPAATPAFPAATPAFPAIIPAFPAITPALPQSTPPSPA